MRLKILGWTVLVIGALGSVIATAEEGVPEPRRVVLWPAGAPGAKGDSKGDRPTLELYEATSAGQSSTGQLAPAIVVIPGGGYGGLAAGHEGVEIARWLNGHGITAGVCLYRHRNRGSEGGYGFPHPMEDARRAVRMMRAESKNWNIDPQRVGMIGFSAGGHLTATVATRHDAGNPDSSDPIERESSRPDVAILGYPVISFGQSHTHRGSQVNLLGKDADEQTLRENSAETGVSETTPPVFLFHTVEDAAVPVANSVVFFQALMESKVPAEMHLFEKGRHGVGLANGIEGTDQWPLLCMAWLKQHGF